MPNCFSNDDYFTLMFTIIDSILTHIRVLTKTIDTINNSITSITIITNQIRSETVLCFRISRIFVATIITAINSSLKTHITQSILLYHFLLTDIINTIHSLASRHFRYFLLIPASTRKKDLNFFSNDCLCL